MAFRIYFHNKQRIRGFYLNKHGPVHKKGRIEEDVSTIGSDAITFLSTVGGVTILATTSQ